ncbi:hypothetical protein K4K49_008175 [Colletotrichum sp. SAR 10_70]|nr:hypothetical protein K4K50_007912 [Colletotrichum sp. SAR 10_71]KAI8157895.1 hypothetical protein K4K49_008175 [Colletotrichum sp. SAR 10_70]KAI8162394.1 hypothetical protein KHU50_007873 [Colletotrichum sp. SAR 10_65]KAI8210903.1 hypothetical protein K4K52_011525 [Colletotrichum sp. SAR 10_76]KAI8229935.1 hypothetical protein K4K54_001146 [Colletotrichum sp. SAR 10_86]
MRSFVFVTIAALAIGQAAAQMPARVQPLAPRQSVASDCETVPECGQGNLGATCQVTCIDNPGGERKKTGVCKDGTFGISCY